MGRRFGAVFFDLDGTLMDHERASEAALLRLLDLRGVDASRRAGALDLWRRLEDEHMGRYLAGSTSFAGQRRARIAGLFEYLGTDLGSRDADGAFSSYLGFYESAWEAFPDVVPALDALGGLRKGVLTNGDPDQQRRKLRALGLAGRFEAVVVSGEVGASKPDPAIFHEACARAELEPSSCAYVGDRLETDAIAAREAGLLGVWVHRERSASGRHLFAGGGLVVVRELTELVGLLRVVGADV